MEETTVTENDGAEKPKSALERSLELVILAADLEKEITLRVQRFGKTCKIHGFRPGKVPEKIVRQQYGQQAHHDALGEMLNKAFADAVNTAGLRVAGYPKIDQKVSDDHPDRLTFTAVFEVFPDVVPGDLAGVEIRRPVLEVGQPEVDRTLDILRRQRVRYDRVERPVQMGDQVKIDFFGKKDGVPFPGGESKDAVFIVGEGAMLPEFERAIIGLSANETRSSEITFPESYFAKELEGKTVTFDIVLKEACEAVLPDIDGEFAKSLGVADGDVGKMRAEIEENLKHEVKKRLEERIKNQVMDALLDVTPLDIPNALVEIETQSMMDTAMQDLAQRGGQAVKNLPVMPEWFAGKAKRRVGLGLILSELVKNNDLMAKPEQVKAAVEEMAQTYDKPSEVVRWYYTQPERLAGIEAVVIENNVVAWALARARIVDQPVEFDELMGQKSRALPVGGNAPETTERVAA